GAAQGGRAEAGVRAVRLRRSVARAWPVLHARRGSNLPRRSRWRRPAVRRARRLAGGSPLPGCRKIRSQAWGAWPGAAKNRLALLGCEAWSHSFVRGDSTPPAGGFSIRSKNIPGIFIPSVEVVGAGLGAGDIECLDALRFH